MTRTRIKIRIEIMTRRLKIHKYNRTHRCVRFVARNGVFLCRIRKVGYLASYTILSCIPM